MAGEKERVAWVVEAEVDPDVIRKVQLTERMPDRFADHLECLPDGLASDVQAEFLGFVGEERGETPADD